MKAIGFRGFCFILSQKCDLHPTSLQVDEEFDSFASFLNAKEERVTIKVYKPLLLCGLIFKKIKDSCI
ncbi:hypothetical protein EDI28_04955 [Photobacterium chitinilyticum]|uniref:Uncharacterized protein n=1 Tax=Photobacterium chitinilyticum TaxID=2485123 RepID=A0A3S3UPR3_9GAMM|nr:hypothetical protein EDI28_04955 [Photobacterium chitinilyticum]